MLDVRWTGEIIPEPIVMSLLCDVHVHLRGKEDEVLTDISLEHGLQVCEIIAQEPNLRPNPVVTVEQALDYRAYTMRKVNKLGYPRTRVLMILQLTPQTTAEMIWDAYRRGVRIVKYYPAGVTTNSDNGIRDWRQCLEAITAMAEICRLYPGAPMVLQIHGEDPNVKELRKREGRFLKVIREIATLFTSLIISVAHASTAAVVFLARQLPNVGLEITGHHLVLTWDDVVHDSRFHEMDGHCFCAPVVKTARDRRALLRAALGLYPELDGRVYLGSDSAPHHMTNKEGGFAWPDKLPNMGIYSLDVLASLLVSIFRKFGGRNWLQRLQEFACWNGAKWFGIEPPQGKMRVTYEPRVVPEYYGDRNLRSFMAGRTVEYKTERLAA